MPFPLGYAAQATPIWMCSCSTGVILHHLAKRLCFVQLVLNDNNQYRIEYLNSPLQSLQWLPSTAESSRSSRSWYSRFTPDHHSQSNLSWTFRFKQDEFPTAPILSSSAFLCIYILIYSPGLSFHSVHICMLKICLIPNLFLKACGRYKYLCPFNFQVLSLCFKKILAQI